MVKGYVVDHMFVEIPEYDAPKDSEVEDQPVEKSEDATEEVA